MEMTYCDVFGTQCRSTT